MGNTTLPNLSVNTAPETSKPAETQAVAPQTQSTKTANELRLEAEIAQLKATIELKHKRNAASEDGFMVDDYGRVVATKIGQKGLALAPYQWKKLFNDKFKMEVPQILQSFFDRHAAVLQMERPENLGELIAAKRKARIEAWKAKQGK